LSTRCTTHFHDSEGSEAEAIIFRHTDGYPSGAGADILAFFDAIEEQAGGDTRFNDASMLAARYVVFLAQMFARDPAAPLDFLSVRVMMQDTADTEYVYHVYCDTKGRPTVTVDGSDRDGMPLQEALDAENEDDGG